MLQKLKPRVLVIDDDPSVCELLGRIFGDTGRYSVETESDPFAAMATARHYRPDIVFLDIRMPGIGGLEIAAEMRAEPALLDRPIVLFTGLQRRELPPHVIRPDNRTVYLEKGASAEIILATVDCLLAIAGAVVKNPAS